EPPQFAEMVTLLVALQRAWNGRIDALLALGLPDGRPPALGAAIADVVARTADDLAAADRATLREFLRDLPARFAAIAACGLPDTLVHGDFHPGNFRGDGRVLTLLDWGDSAVGHPLLDQPAFLTRLPADAVAHLREHWLRLWRAAIPSSDPARAADLLAPVAAARQAAIYQAFLDPIEPAQHPFPPPAPRPSPSPPPPTPARASRPPPPPPPTPPAPPPSPPRFPPPPNPPSTRASSPASSRPSPPTTATIPPNGCSALPPWSANS